MGLFSSLGQGFGLGVGFSSGNALVDHYLQPPRTRQVWTQLVERTRLTVMQLDGWGKPPRWELYAIWDGQSDVVGRFDSWPQLQAGVDTIGVYLKMGGSRDHFWRMAELPEPLVTEDDKRKYAELDAELKRAYAELHPEPVQLDEPEVAS